MEKCKYCNGNLRVILPSLLCSDGVLGPIYHCPFCLKSKGLSIFGGFMNKKQRPVLFVSRIEFRDGKKEHESLIKDFGDICAICLEDLRKYDLCHRLPCKHIFHKECLATSLSNVGKCPLCREKYMTDVVLGCRCNFCYRKMNRVISSYVGDKSGRKASPEQEGSAYCTTLGPLFVCYHCYFENEIFVGRYFLKGTPMPQFQIHDMSDIGFDRYCLVIDLDGECAICDGKRTKGDSCVKLYCGHYVHVRCFMKHSKNMSFCYECQPWGI